MNCPACDNKETVKLGMKHKEYELCRCPACDLMFWHPMKAPGPDSYQAWPVDFTAIRPVWSPHTAYKKFFRDMPARGGRLLDVGCGIGDFCYLAEKAGYSVTGIDFAPQFIEVARRRFPSLDFETTTLDEFAAKRTNDKYDVVTFIEVLEHLDNIRNFLQSVRKVIKPGGYAVCSVPNREKFRLFTQLLRGGWDYPPNHFTWWNKNCLSRLFDSFGFSIPSIETDPATLFDCSYLISEKLYVTRAAEWLGRKLLGSTPTSNISSQGSVTRRLDVAKLGYRFYYRVLLPFFGILTSPLVPLLRKSGNSIYLVAQLRV